MKKVLWNKKNVVTLCANCKFKVYMKHFNTILTKGTKKEDASKNES